jgi:tyrosine-protein kinase Etk/Wzc
MYENEVNFSDYFQIFRKYKRFIIVFIFVVSIASVIISLMLPKLYKAQATILSPSDNSGAMSAFGSDLSMFGLSGLISEDSTQMRLLAILKSIKMLELLDIEFDFQTKYEEKFKFKTYSKIHSNMHVVIGEEDQFIISFIDKDQELVKDIVKHIVHSLDSLNIELSNTKARQNREFIQTRIEIVADSLSAFEHELMEFMKSNHLISIDDQMSSTVSTAAELKAIIMAKEIELELKKMNHTEFNPEINSLENELGLLTDNFDGFFINDGNKLLLNLDNVPQVQREYIKLQRKIKYFTKLLEYLGPQFEQSKIEEEKDIPTIQILDEPKRPEWKYKPKRAVIVIGAFFFALFFSWFVVITIEYLKTNPKA